MAEQTSEVVVGGEVNVQQEGVELVQEQKTEEQIKAEQELKEQKRIDAKQAILQIILGIADEIVELSNEEKQQVEQNKNAERNGASSEEVKRLIYPLLQKHAIQPVSTLFPSPSSHIVQPKVLKQKKNDSCGYYALYNIVTIASALTSPSPADALVHIQSLRHRTRFWRFYYRIISHLYKKCNATKKYPWTYEHIDKGILERPYISYLMDKGYLQGNIDITVLADFSMTGMRHNILPMEELGNLAKVFANYKSEKTRKGEESPVNGEDIAVKGEQAKVEGEPEEERKEMARDNRIHAFMVGQACHWISLICVKYEGKIEVLVFDSRNHNLLTSTHEDFMRIVDKSKEKIPDWKKKIYMCSLTEPKMTADLFHDCVLGVRDVITSLLEHNMEGFLHSFEEHVEKSELKDVWIVPFISWLEMYWPPPVVESNIIKVLQMLGVSKLSQPTREKFLRMAKAIREGVGNFEECSIPVVQRFEAILQWLELNFSAN